MRLFIIVLTFLIASNAMAQKKQLVESKEEVEMLAKKEFDMAMTGPEGSLYLFGAEQNIKGEYTFKVTLGDRGKVVSVFVIGREGGDIPAQNKAKDAVKAFRFNFKLPKNKNYSFEHKFKF